MSISGQMIPTLTSTDTYRYLGLPVGSDFVSHKAGVASGLEEKLMRLNRSALTPQQKLYGIRTCLIPGLYHELSLGAWREGFLKAVDCTVRAAVRKALHLPHDTPNAYIQAKPALGGIGVPSIRDMTLSIRHRRLKSLGNSPDPVLRTLSEGALIRGAIHQTEGKLLVESAQCAEAIGKLDSSTNHRLFGTMDAKVAERLFRSTDGAGLRHSLQARSKCAWVSSHGSELSGRELVCALKVRLKQHVRGVPEGKTVPGHGDNVPGVVIQVLWRTPYRLVTSHTDFG